ncbi:MAG: RNA polymerase subunit sigma-70 [Lachnospiraceae bacterium]|nr:RNA polymerase subunit sigma-70 [Lachnospiraceae bacterium]
MNKQILENYIDACELIREIEKEIKRLHQKTTVIRTSVLESDKDFPYEKQHFVMNETALSVQENPKLRYEEKLLQEQKANAERIRLEVQQFLNTVSPRIQRIIQMKYFEGKTWEEVAKKLGRKATADSVRIELKRFLQKG